MPTFGSLLVIIGDSLLYTRLYGGAGEPENSPNDAHKKRAPGGTLLLKHSPHNPVVRGFIPVRLRSSRKPYTAVYLTDRGGWFWGGYAAQRG